MPEQAKSHAKYSHRQYRANLKRTNTAAAQKQSMCTVYTDYVLIPHSWLFEVNDSKCNP